jgi:hypothetical protein
MFTEVDLLVGLTLKIEPIFRGKRLKRPASRNKGEAHNRPTKQTLTLKAPQPVAPSFSQNVSVPTAFSSAETLDSLWWNLSIWIHVFDLARVLVLFYLYPSI